MQLPDTRFTSSMTTWAIDAPGNAFWTIYATIWAKHSSDGDLDPRPGAMPASVRLILHLERLLDCWITRNGDGVPADGLILLPPGWRITGFCSNFLADDRMRMTSFLRLFRQCLRRQLTAYLDGGPWSPAVIVSAPYECSALAAGPPSHPHRECMRLRGRCPRDFKLPPPSRSWVRLPPQAWRNAYAVPAPVRRHWVSVR
jgi:hypothetical protein